MRFLFWNVGRRDVTDTVVMLVRRYDVDVLVLLEDGTRAGDLLWELNSRRGRYGLIRDGRDQGWPTVYAKTRHVAVRPVGDYQHLSVFALAVASAPELLMAVVHLPSKVSWDDHSQTANACHIAGFIREVETRRGHSRTMAFGDFNMHPFDPGMVVAGGLHAVMSRDVAAEGRRTVQGRDWPFFYNPMWGLLGDETPGPPGSYYFRQAVEKCYFWSMLDQVLFRPALLPVCAGAEGARVSACRGPVPALGQRCARPRPLFGSSACDLCARIAIEEVSDVHCPPRPLADRSG